MTRSMRRLLWAALALTALLFAGRWTVTALADYWWGLSISGEAGRFIGGVELLKAALDLGGFVLAAAWFTANFLLVHRAIGTVEVSRQIANIEVREALPARSTLAPFVVSGLVLGLIAGSDLGRHWRTLALAWTGVRYGVADPVLGHDAGLYIAQLPLWSLGQRSVLVLVAATLVLVLTLYAFIGAVRWIDGRPALNTHARRHLGWLLTGLAVALAAGFLVEPFLLVGGARGALAARAYNLASMASLFLTGTAAIAAIASLAWAYLARYWLHWFLVAIWMILAAGSFLARVVSSSFSVPAEPLLADTATRLQLDAAAYDLASRHDSLVLPQASLPARPDVPSLWRAPALMQIAGADSTALLTANPGVIQVGKGRERAWLVAQQDRGGRVGIRAIADDRVSATGAPLFYHANDSVPAPVPAWLTELPASAISPAASAVAIGTDLHGVRVGGLAKRAALAWALQEPDLLQPPSGQVSVDWARDPRERVAKLAPFAEWGEAQVHVDSAGVRWMIDGLVSSRYFPLSSRVPQVEGPAGLVRAGFVAVVEAGSGAVRIFARPEGGPLADAWTTLSSRVVEPWSRMPEQWRSDLSYPAGLLGAQARVLERPALGRYVGGADSLRVSMPVDEFFWAAGAIAPARTAVYVAGTPARVRTLAIGSTREGRLRLEVLELDSAVALASPSQLRQSWERFPTWVQVVDSVRAGGGMISPGEVRYWAAPGIVGAMQVQYGPRGGGGTSITWVNLAAGGRLGAGRNFNDAWSNLLGSSIPAPPGSDGGGVLGDARKWFRIADSAFRRGDFTAFGRAFEALRSVLEVPPIESR